MSEEADGLIRVFDKLTPSQKAEAIERLNRYLDADQETKKQIVREAERNQVRKVDVGPVGRICPYCGR
jgi:hypothetical protein